MGTELARIVDGFTSDVTVQVLRPVTFGAFQRCLGIADRGNKIRVIYEDNQLHVFALNPADYIEFVEEVREQVPDMKTAREIGVS